MKFFKYLGVRTKKKESVINLLLSHFYSCPHMSGHNLLNRTLWNLMDFYSCPHMSGHQRGLFFFTLCFISIHARI